MRKIESSVVLQYGAREAWARLATTQCWQQLTEAFSGRRCRYVVAGDGGVLGVGTEVEVTTPGGKPIMRWRVSEWSPLKSLELSVDESRRFLTPFHMMMRFRLEELDHDKTRVYMSLVIIYMNRILEILSLVLPVGFMYTRGINRSLASLKGN